MKSSPTDKTVNANKIKEYTAITRNYKRKSEIIFFRRNHKIVVKDLIHYVYYGLITIIRTRYDDI